MMIHMKKFIRTLILLGLTLVYASVFATSAYAKAGASTKDLGHPVASSKVVLILAPFVTWDDITPQTTPAIFRATQTGAIGDINARSRAKETDGEPSIVEGALSVSAGAWALIDNGAYSAYDVNERVEFDFAGQAYKRMTGNGLENQSIVYLGLPSIIKANSDNPFKVIPGTLGSAVKKQDGYTAALGNSDLGFASAATQRLVRPAALAAMNDEGEVDFGTVSESILIRDDEAPFGVSTDLRKMETDLESIKKKMPQDKPGLIVLDSGDLYRAYNYASVVSDNVATKNWDEALGKLDSVYSMAERLYPNDTVIVAAQASRDKEIGKEGFGPIVISNMKPGLLMSNSTQRPGLVTNLDLTATILNVLKIDQPVEVLGSPMESTTHYSVDVVGDEKDDAANRLDLLMKMNKTAISIENNRPVVINTFVVLTVLILVFGALVIIRAPKHWNASTLKTVRRAIRLLILAVLAVPASSWLMFLIYRWPGSPLQVTSQLLVVAAGLWVLTLALSWRFGARVPLIFITAITSLVIVVDQLLGAPASFTSFFGYSPIAAARFYGIGNEGAAVLFGAVVIGIVMALDQWPQARWVPALKTWGIPLIGFIMMFVSAAPMLGANVGVAAWATVGFILLWFLVNDKKITWKSIALMFLIVVLVVGMFIVFDKYGSGQETHLARAVNSAEKGGIVQLWDIVLRKVETNLRVLTHTNLVWILLAVIAFLGVMRWRPTGEFAVTLKKNPYFASGMSAILIGGMVAYFTEDSGVVLPALMVLYLGCGIVWLMLGLVRNTRGEIDE